MYRNKCAVVSLAFQVTDQVTQSTKSSLFFISPNTEKVQASTKHVLSPPLSLSPSPE